MQHYIQRTDKRRGDLRNLIIAGLVFGSGAFSPLAFADTNAPAKVQTETNMISHKLWTDLLSRYVRPNEDGVNRFDYALLKATTDDRKTLDTYIDDLTSLNISQLDAPQKFTVLANLYNALTVRIVLENYPIDSITKIRPGLFSIGPWKKDLVQLDGKDTSLDDIEHGMLRKQFDDPRVHYAVNCASYGCPNLQTKAWTPETLNADLDAAARAYINHPRGVSIRKDGRLEVSKIYAWFKEDFGGNEKGVIDHLLKYADDSLAQRIKTNPDIAEYAYDWSLNDVPSGE